MSKLWSAYKQLLRAEALFGLGFFAGCFFAGFLTGLGRLHP
jgi:hypothetical protein